MVAPPHRDRSEGLVRWYDGARRRVVTRASARRSRFVGLMKLVLPLAAAVLLMLVVVWPGPQRDAVSFRLSYLGGSDAEREPKLGMVNARYIGTDSHDRPFVITADRAVPAGENRERFRLERIQADITLEDGRWLALSASSGLYARDRETLRLDAPVNLYSDDGYAFSAETTDVDLSTGIVTSDRPVSGQGPVGHLDAGGFRVVNEGQRLYFSGGVTVVIYPRVRG